MHPPARRQTGAAGADKAMPLHRRLQNILPPASKIEVTSIDRPARIDLNRPTPDQNGRTVAPSVHLGTDPSEEAKRGFEFGTVGG